MSEYGDTVPLDEGETATYLILPTQKQPNSNQVVHEVTWCKIGDAGDLEYINWEAIENFAREYDKIGNEGERNQSQVICKLLTLVREQTRKEFLNGKA